MNYENISKEQLIDELTKTRQENIALKLACEAASLLANSRQDLRPRGEEMEGDTMILRLSQLEAMLPETNYKG